MSPDSSQSSQPDAQSASSDAEQVASPDAEPLVIDDATDARGEIEVLTEGAEVSSSSGRPRGRTRGRTAGPKQTVALTAGQASASRRDL
ncbi:MAG: hypothetical protein ACI8U4_000468 [Natronomonas sp.]|jgi:hypothetical protein